MAPSSLDWQWKRFSELTLEELYRMLALRSEVFVVEQRSLYLDADGLDAECFHLLGGVPGTEQLGAYLRALPPGLKFPEASLGRVVTAPALRGQRQGRDLVERGLHFLAERFPGAPVRIGAQAYLQRFYEGFGFVAVSDIYDEDGIPHLDMRRG
ncbi:GNAT family N-acetyltransferase [Corallococcus exiguus]|uniref:GNAT family N-acetyltransferase n=1 Tax=Corallococcus exiguus TaxID=83462 RepID=UPI001471DC21|nr:GNAT family N-acetyltransferase [Corallococcus exiguus]NNB94149.1 GNAT family N-acetyltransferase [Corallococcus exiguus]NNC03417.1 GNAT family N-acetyltransferase [Corallococcus exiguus]